MPNLMIIFDGVQDTRYQQLGGKTPLEYGERESIAEIRRASAQVTLSTTPPGMEADTLVCVLTLLGVTPDKLPSGRSSLEALAEGVRVGENDLIMRCNYVKIADDGVLEVPCCEPPEDIALALSAAVRERHGNCPLKRIGPYKSLQTIEDGKRYLDGMVMMPPHNNAGKPLAELLPRGNTLAEELAKTTMELYSRFRPYTVFNWAPSVREEVPAFRDLHGLSGGMVTKTLVTEGIAKMMGMSCPVVPGGTGDIDTNLAEKVRLTLDLLKERDFVLLHIGGTDEATHRQNPLEKAEFVARLDRELLAPILDALPYGARVMFTSDHAALCSTSGHTIDPVEAYLYEKGASHKRNHGLMPGTQAIELLCVQDWEA